MKAPRSSSIFLLLLFLLLAAFAWKRGFFSCEKKKSPIATSSSSGKNISVIGQKYSKQSSTNQSNESTSLQARRTIPIVPAPLDHLSDQELQEFPGGRVVESAQIDGPEPGEKTRLRILKTNFKYPLIRTEEVVDEKNNSVVMREEMVASHLLVTLAEGEDPQEFLKKMGSLATSIVKVNSSAPLYRLNLLSSNLEALPEALEKSTSATAGIGEPDFLSHLHKIPEKPLYEFNQWAFWSSHYSTPIYNGHSTWYQYYRPNANDQSYYSCYPGINAEAAWDIRTDASSVIVAVIDSGIRYTHHDLAPNMWHNPRPSAAGDLYGWNAYDDNGDPNSVASDQDPDSGHGTHCAGTIGAFSSENGETPFGVAGVAWKVQLMACKYSGPGDSGTLSDEITCLDYAITHGAQIINCSFGNYSWSHAEYNAYKRARDHGIIVVTAAGNDASDESNNLILYPSSFQLDNIVSVAALDQWNCLATFSNYGGDNVHLAAPGVDIFSTWNSSDDAHQHMDGTSAAAPFVTGAFALLKAHFPKESYRQLIARLLHATNKNQLLEGKTITGGSLNIARALMGPTPSDRDLYAPHESYDEWAQSLIENLDFYGIK
jgi:subtilisin family serine protease